MSISYRDRDFNIELEALDFLYSDESVRKACEYVDTQRDAIDWTFDSLMDVTRTAIRKVIVADHKMKLVVEDVFFYTVDEFLIMYHIAEENRFHNYLMCDALSYYLYMHSSQVKYKRYWIDEIDITERIKKELQTCACGHKKPKVVISTLLEKICIKIICPYCGTQVIEFLDRGRMIKAEKEMYLTEYTFNSLGVAINDCIRSWKVQCGKATDYKALELLIGEFTGPLDVTPKVMEYSLLLHGYVQRNKLDKGIGEDYEGKLAKKLYQDRAAMDIVHDYLWENSSNKDGDGIQPLETWDFRIFSLAEVRGASQIL